MRIVYFLPDVEAGVSKVVRTLLFFKPAYAVEHVVVLMHQEGSEEAVRITEPFGGEMVHRFVYNPLDNVYNIYRVMSSLLLADDIIVGNDGYEVRMVAALKLGNPLVYIIHGDNDYYYMICKLNESIIDSFITISKKIYKTTTTLLEPRNIERIKLIYFPSASLLNSRNSAVKSDVFKIVFAGTLSERKGAELLFPIFRRISQVIPHFQLDIIGGGDLKQMIDEQFRNVENIAVKGWMKNDDVLKQIGQSHVFLFPSYTEGLPNVLIEALSTGSVPVSSNLDSGVKDIIIDGKNGLIVDAGDIEGFANAIAYLYHHPDRLAEMREAGKAGLGKFDPRKQAKEYYEQIIAVANSEGDRAIRKFPVYPMGGVLNKPWMPNIVCRTIRKMVGHPKL